ncbi:MAG: hypothetical protein APR54_10275 [Candidatus Cloacimonas sp. SDB]|nr:MAG: hypothetical protein APR54_10275 [Candidatus Cloacimonas sp. SDB]
MKKILILVILFIFVQLSTTEKVGLALSGGGARGFAHVGVLKAIDEMNIKIDYIAGTSIGAVIGALYAIGYTGAEIENIILELNWRDLLDDKVDREDVYIGQKRWKPYANFNFYLAENFSPMLPRGFSSGNTLVNKLFDLTFSAADIADFDEFLIPFRCTATDVLSGELKVFDSGSLHEAIRASISFPTFLEPFEIENKFYIDGGINANFPVEIVSNMGADYIIGVQVTSGLKEQDELITLIDILDQTVNFKINENVEESKAKCNILIDPALEDFSNLSFDQKSEIIEQGEIAARKILKKVELPLRGDEIKNKPSEPDYVFLNKITITGNENLSSSKIKRFLGLEEGVGYSKKQILAAFERAYNVELFDYIYPRFEEQTDGKKLIVKLKERNRKKLGINYTYNDRNQFVAGIILELNNYIQRNSKLLFNLQLGNITEVDLDYVKNFGRTMGVYFRLFPHFREHRLFSYNENHEKVNSVKSRQKGITGGIGFFAQYAVNAEFFAFTYDTEMYRDIAEFEEKKFRSSGLGFKLYHENLDDFMFPMRGSQILAKISKAHREYYSDVSYNKFSSKLKLILPLGENLSFKYQFEYGSYFDSDDVQFDPFLIGGIDSFLGLNYNEMSAPIYKINTLCLRFRLYRELYSDLQYNVLTLGDSDVWLPENSIYHGAGINIGYNAAWGPIRFAAALDEDLESYLYFSFGYEWDFFEFSRH